MWPPFLALLLPACTRDRVDVTGIPAFGAVSSAAYHPSTTVEGFVLGDGSLASLGILRLPPVLHVDSAGLSCEDRLGWWFWWSDASDALLESSMNGNDEEALCEAVPGFLAALAAAPADEAEHRLELGFCADASCEADPAPGELPLPAATSTPVTEGMSRGSLTYRERAAERWQLAEAAWDEARCAFDEDWRAEEDERAAGWTLVDGVVEVEGAEEGGWVSVRAEARVVDENVRADGRLDARARAGWCELPGPDRVVWVE